MVVGGSVEEAIASSSMSRLGWSLVVGHSVVSWGMRRPLEIATVTFEATPQRCVNARGVDFSSRFCRCAG